MLVGGHKHDPKPHLAWKSRAYPVPAPSRSGFRFKASALRRMQQWSGGTEPVKPVAIMVPALYNFLPAESIAMGWLNEIDALVTIRQRMICAAKLTGWDVFTFHTLYNVDHFFDSTITAVRDTWVKEGNLSPQAISATREKFAKPYDYHRIQPRLIENLVFQASLLDWLGHRAADVPLRFHVIGTALLSALVSSGAVSFAAAVKSAMAFGARWDSTLCSLAEAKTDADIGWSRFEQVRKLMEGRSSLSLPVAQEDLPEVDAPARPFWYSAKAKEPPVLISTAAEATAALATLNLASWAYAVPEAGDEPIRGWLVSALHPMARICRWTVSNYLLATPGSTTLFLDHIATLGRRTLLEVTPEPDQNRFRLSKIKVTGP